MTEKETGDKGEQAACEYLADDGAKIICRNYHSRYGEIDIIAADDTYILFVEVKTRRLNSLGDPRDAVNRRKQKKIIITAMDYLMKHPADLQPRFDVIEVITSSTGIFKDVKINHLKNAFCLEDRYGLF